MVEGVHAERGAAEHLGDAALGIERHLVNRVVVPVVARVLGNVLHERAAERDVEHLDAPAHAEGRLVALDERAAQRELGRVAQRVDGPGLGDGIGPVPFGLDVAAAGDDHGVDGVEGQIELGPIVGIDDRQDDRDRAGAAHGLHVRHRGREVQQGEAGLVDEHLMGGDTDDGEARRGGRHHISSK